MTEIDTSAEAVEAMAAKLDEGPGAGCADGPGWEELCFEAATLLRSLLAERDGLAAPCQIDGCQFPKLLAEREEWREACLSHGQKANRAEAQLATAQAALEPFAIVGRLIDRYFAQRPDGEAFKSGCAWEQDNVKRTLTWGDFRRARAALPTPVHGREE